MNQQTQQQDNRLARNITERFKGFQDDLDYLDDTRGDLDTLATLESELDYHGTLGQSDRDEIKAIVEKYEDLRANLYNPDSFEPLAAMLTQRLQHLTTALLTAASATQE